MTADGRLLVLHGNSANNGNGGHLMYSYNEKACAVSGWSTPHVLSELHLDTEPALQKYPLSWNPLTAATGELYDSEYTVIGAYPWLDHEGRNVLYTAASHPKPVGGRREAVSLIGADTGYMAVHLDGSINESRDTVPKLFYSSPMWQFERERHPSLLMGNETNTRHYLPVTKTHDVLPLFGSNTEDYNEVDIGILKNPHYMLYLPMNELVTRAGEYDLTRTPDLSGHGHVGRLRGTALVTPTNNETHASLLQGIQGRGKALAFDGAGAVTIRLKQGVSFVDQYMEGLTVQFLLRPATSACGKKTERVVMRKYELLEILSVGDDSVEMRLKVGQTWITAYTISLTLDAWTHVAWSFDGVAGSLKSYRNGVHMGNTVSLAPGTVHITPGKVWIGAPSTSMSRWTCPKKNGAFIGFIDEVAIYAHTRSGRSICNELIGADCAMEAIQDSPTAGQYHLSHQEPGCKSSAELGSLPCIRAGHRVCAQHVADAYLAANQNNPDAVNQVVSDRPPVSMAAVPVSTTADHATLACTPTNHESLPIDFADLAAHDSSCTGERVADTIACLSAAHHFCSSIGWTTGTIFEVTSRPWITCFRADLVASVDHNSELYGCDQGMWTTTNCRISISKWCRTKGYDGGIAQGLQIDNQVRVHCFYAAAVLTLPF
uniref:LamG-like jellyroll fold domain-containing protein n=1 Tax=Attheya septentrionalis TaxID=420275 RepID=A0A7S2XPN4_9STRA